MRTEWMMGFDPSRSYKAFLLAGPARSADASMGDNFGSCLYFLPLLDGGDNVPVGQMMEDTNREFIVSIGVSAFPTFRFYLEGNQIDEIRGANIAEVAAKVR